MDSNHFDRLTRLFGSQRTRRTAATLVGGALVAPILVVDDLDARKRRRRKKRKKKTCPKKCKDGCCTGKRGTCVRPSQQTLTQCGTGGEICRSTGCPECTPSLPCPVGQCCGGDGTCGSCLVFVTSERHNGNFGGLAGGDAFCQDLASAAGLPGTYRAWLSDATGSPSIRFTQATEGYTLVDGTVIADDWSELISGTLKSAILKTETGANNAVSLAWTGTEPNGVVIAGGGNTCGLWSDGGEIENGWLGETAKSNSEWTDAGSIPCNQELVVYCFQQR